MQLHILLLSCLVAFVFSQENTYRIDLALEYTGNVNWKNNSVTLTATSETIRTILSANGYINYEVITRLKGAVSAIMGPIIWVIPGQTFTSVLSISFGASHISRPHVLHTSTLGTGFVLESHQDTLTTVSQYNVTSGEGAFVGVTGGVVVNGHHQQTSGSAIWIVNAILWIPMPNPPPPEETQ